MVKIDDTFDTNQTHNLKNPTTHHPRKSQRISRIFHDHRTVFTATIALSSPLPPKINAEANLTSLARISTDTDGVS